MSLIDYIRGNWANGETGGTPLSATNLNNMDEGIYQLDQALGRVSVDTSGDYTLSTTLYTNHGVVIPNSTGSDSRAYWVQDSSATNRRALYMSSSDVLTLGLTSYETAIRGSAVTVSGVMTVTSGVVVGNNTGRGYRIKDSDGTEVMMLYMSASNLLGVGDKSYGTRIFGSDIQSNVAISVSSDARLKEDFDGLGTAHDALFDGLQPLTYRYIGSDRRHIGLTVQDTEAAMQAAGLDPREYALTTWTPDPETGERYGALAYDELIGLLVAQVQTLKARVAALEEVISHA